MLMGLEMGDQIPSDSDWEQNSQAISPLQDQESTATQLEVWTIHSFCPDWTTVDFFFYLKIKLCN